MRVTVRMARGIAAMVLFAAAVLAFGHLVEFSLVYRPLPQGPASHPLTVILAALLGAGLLLVSPVRRVSGAVQWVFLLAGGLAFLRLVELLALPELRAEAVSGIAAFGARAGHGATGTNTLVTALFIAAGQLLRSRRPHVGLVMAAAAPVLPLIAGFGYAFGLPALYGEMSPVTVALLLPLALAGLSSFVRRQALRPLFCATFLGRSARVEFLAGLGFPLAVGALIAQRNPEGAADTAVQAALMALFAATVVVVKTRAHARTEVQRRRTVRALKTAAVTDHLTGLVNRHGASMRIDALTADRPAGVILADLDNFKTVNDVWGHAAGDRVLIDVARILRDRFGAGEIVARWGGEEFLMILPGRSLEETLGVAEELRTRVAGLHGPGGKRGEITASFGVSQRLPRERSLDGAMYRADVALYNAKDAGRDKVVRDACAGCKGATRAMFQRERLLSDEGAMGCGCAIGDPGPRGNVSTASDPGPGNLN